jgi:hypothetical protein
MTYTANKIEGQNLMYNIVTQHNDKEISFDVVCANDESEISELVKHHLNYLDNPNPVVQQPTQQTVDVNEVLRQQQALIADLTARLAALEGTK